MYSQDFLERPIANSFSERRFFGIRLNYYRIVRGRKNNGSVEHIGGLRCRICSVRIEYLFLCICSATAWGGTHKCILCGRTFYSRSIFSDYIQRDTDRILLCFDYIYDNRCVAVLQGRKIIVINSETLLVSGYNENRILTPSSDAHLKNTQ